MNKQEQRVEIKSPDDGLIELRCYDRLRSSRYCSWEMPADEARDLARWWRNEGANIKSGQLPVVSRKFGNVLISMFAQARVEVRPIDRFGRPKFRAYSLPRAVIESLVASLEQVRPGSSEKESRKCSTRSL